MLEWKRIFLNRIWLFSLLIIFVCNLAFYIREQAGTLTVPLEQYRNSDQRWQKKLSVMPYEQGLAALTEAENRLYIWSAAKTLAALRNEDTDTYQSMIELYRTHMPAIDDYVDKAARGEAPELDAEIPVISTWKQRLTYLCSYDDCIGNIHQQAERMKTFCSDTASYEYRNIIKTDTDFTGLTASMLRSGNDNVILSVIEDNLTVIWIILFMAMTCVLVVGNSRVQTSVYVTPKGHGSLAVRRAGAIMLSAFICSSALYGGKLLASRIFWGEGANLGRLVQSIEVFQYWPIPMTIFTFMLLYGLLLFIGACVIGFAFWLIFSMARSIKYALIVVAGVLTAEYYWFINVNATDANALLSSLNVFTFFQVRPLFYRYRNLNFFDTPVSEWCVVCFAAVGILLFLCCACIINQIYHRPCHSSFDKLGLKNLKITGGISTAESYKLWLINGALSVFLLFACYVWIIEELPPLKLTQKEIFQDQYCMKYEGEFSADKIKMIRQALSQAQKEVELLQKKTDDEKQMPVVTNELSYRCGQVEALSELQEHCVQLHDLEQQGYHNLWILSKTPYERFFGASSYMWRSKNCMVLVLTLSLMLTPLFGYEYTSQIRTHLLTTPLGRSLLWKKKVMLGVISTTLLWLISVFGELFLLFTEYGRFPGITAGGLSISALAPQIGNAPIWFYVLTTYGCRLLYLLSFSFIIFLISNIIKTREYAIGACIIILIIPALMVNYLKQNWLAPLSGTVQMAAIGPDITIKEIVIMIVYLFAGTAALLYSEKQWRRYAA